MALLLEPGRDFGRPAPPGRALALPDLKRGGVGVLFATIFAPSGFWKGESASQAARRQMRCYDELLLRHADDLFRLESRGDLSLCRAGGPIGLVHLMEGADPIDRTDEVARWAEDGVRFIGLAWNTPNRWSGGTKDDGGLTNDGRRLLAAMEAEGVVPDLSHLNTHALDDVLAAWSGLVVASHSNAHAVLPHRRNLSDAHLAAIAERDGVIGVMLYGPLLAAGRATIDDVIRHVEHVVEVTGPEHVAIGSDLDGGFTTDMAPDGIGSAADLLRIADALRVRGWREADVLAVMGRNWIRVLERVLPA